MDKRSKIAILGYGTEGEAMFKYLLKHGHKNITICDKNINLEGDLPDGISSKLGKDYLNGLEEFDVIFRSPGIRYLSPQIQSVVNLDTSEISSGTAFFLDQCPCKVIGVTGTKGKGTTSTLIHLTLEKEGKRSFLGGNIGTPPIEFLDDLKKEDLVVLELSSFQLQDLTKSPHYAVLLNTTSDHLDYHADTDEYLTAKEQILINQSSESLAVLNKDYEYSKYYTPLVKGVLKTVSVDKKVKDGAYVNNNTIFYVKDGKEKKVVDMKEIKLIGSHNLENILPAIVIAMELEVKLENIRNVIKTFEGLAHRLEFVREFKGVRFYNDSFSTTPETSMAAVDSFDEPMVLIAGGSPKGADYGEWALKILTKPNLKTVILIGEDAEKMEEALIDAEDKLGDAEGSPTKIIRRKDFDDVIIDAYAEAEEGGVVVLSPATASFGMFKNYKERGRIFMELVGKLN